MADKNVPDEPSDELEPKVLDLNAKREERMKAAGREVRRIGPIVVFGEKEFQLPVEMPLQVSIIASRISRSKKRGPARNMEVAEALDNMAKIMLGDQYEAFMYQGVSLDDLSDFFEAMPELYGVESGES